MGRHDCFGTAGIHWRARGGRRLFAGLVDHSEKGRESAESWSIVGVTAFCGPAHPLVRVFETNVPTVGGFQYGWRRSDSLGGAVILFVFQYYVS